jgi:hypothetical protein
MFNGRKTMTTKEEVNHYRTTARVVGVLYVAGFVVGIGGQMLIQSVLAAPNYLATVSANSMMLAIGALLWLITAAGDAAHGILMFPILKQHSERMALGYFAARIMDAVFIAIMVLFLLLQIPLGSEYLKAAAPDTFYLQALSAVSVQVSQYAYQMAMITLGAAGLVLCTALYRATLVPRWLAVWGIIGYAVIFCGMVSEMMGSGLGLASTIPGGLWELFAGVWLVVKGFNPSAFVAQPASTGSAAELRLPLSEPANP